MNESKTATHSLKKKESDSIMRAELWSLGQELLGVTRTHGPGGAPSDATLLTKPPGRVTIQRFARAGHIADKSTATCADEALTDERPPLAPEVPAATASQPVLR